MIMLSVVLPTPLKANAVSDDDTKKLYIIGTIASYAGINIDIDAVLERFPNFLNDVMELAQDIYDELAEEYSWNDPDSDGHSGSGVHRDENNVVVFTKNLENYLDSLSLGLFPYNPVSQIVNYKFILCVVRAISQWCENNLGGSSASGGNDAFGTVSVSDNTIDFYTAGSISLTLPDYDPNDYNIVHFYLNGCTIDFHINIPDAREMALWGRSTSGYSEDPYINGYDIVITPNDCDLFAMIGSSFNSASMSGKTLSNYASSSSHFNIIFDGFYDICIFDVDNTKFISDGHIYYIVPYSSGYSFADLYDNSIVYNSSLVFNTKFDAARWFWNLCGIDITPSQPSVYTSTPSGTSPVVIDNDTVTQTITTVTNYINNDNSTTSMIFPSYYITNNYYNYDDYRQHPDYILDFSQDGLYNSSFDLPAYDGNKWATKFPFCIPFDIIHLFSGFSASAEAPEFHFIVLPANSFGLQNDEFSVDVDFQDFNVVVQVLRFFIAVSFLIWLMLITNNIIKH